MSPRLNENLKDTTRHGTETPGRRRVGRAFVVVQIGLAVVLLICSGLLVRSFVKLSNQPIGFEPENSLVFSLGLPESKYPTPESVTQFYGELLRRLRTVPGVVAVGGTHAVPLSGANSVRPFIREGDAPGSDAPTSEYRLITPGYFAAMGIPVTRGRDFNDSDGAGRPGAIIVSESFARRHLRNRDPLGQRIRQGGDNPEIPWLTVVGVVGDVRHFGLGADVQPEMFWPEAQATWGATLNRLRRSLNIVVRTTDSPEGLVPAIRSHIAAMDPNRPMIDARPLRTVVAQAADLQRFSMALVTVFAVVGLVLSMAGVYALSSYAVAVRRREIGIRLALGAEPRTVLVQVLRSGVTLAAAGAALGLLVAGAIGDWIQPQLFDTAPRDPATFAGVAAILLATALVASFVPARRASRVNPIEALRTD
jgi:predicted permease